MVKKLHNLPEDVKNDPHVRGLLAQADKHHDLSALASTEGGKALIDQLIKDTVNGVHRLRGAYKTATHIELVSIVAEMSAKIETATLLLKAKNAEAVISARLEEALRE